MLIDALTDVYNLGADYVDIVGVRNDVQDTVTIVVKEEYINTDDVDDDDDDLDKLSDEDINNLLNE